VECPPVKKSKDDEGEQQIYFATKNMMKTASNQVKAMRRKKCSKIGGIRPLNSKNAIPKHLQQVLLDDSETKAFFLYKEKSINSGGKEKFASWSRCASDQNLTTVEYNSQYTQ